MTKRHLAQYDSEGRKMPIYLEANEVDVNGRPLDEVIGEGVYDPQYVHTDNNYTTAEKNKLAGLRNYDDTDVQTAIRNINDAIDRLTGTSDTTEIIDTMNEVIDFLSGLDNTDSLANELVSIRQQLANKLNAGDAYNKHQVDDLLDAKQDIINDLVTIRNGARLGATAVQTETDPTVPSWAKQPRKPTYTAAEVGALPANTTIPQGTVTAVKVNDGQPVYPNASGVVSLTISASGAQVQPDWDETNTESPAYIQNKPNVANAISVNQHSYVMNNNHAFVIPDYYTKSEVDDKVANAGKVKSVSVNDEDPVQPDQNGNVHLEIEGGEGKSAYQSYLDTTTDNPKKTEAEWVASLKGQKGDTGNCQITGDGSNIVSLIVNDLTTGGAGNMLSAEMGKRLKALIDAYESRIDALEESGAALVSVEGTTLVISRMNEPVVIVGDLTKDALTAVAGGESITSDFFVSGRNLEGNIGIELSDTTNFSVVPTQIVPSDGKVQTTMVSVKFNPAAGLSAGSTHSCTISVTYGGVAKKTMAIVGTVAASASVSLSPSSLTLRAVQGAQTSGTITLQGVALSGDVTLALTGTGLSFDDDAVTTTKTVSRADAENGTPITIYYTAGSSNVNGSLTATSGSAIASATVTGEVVESLDVGSYFDVPVGNGKLRYTVLNITSVSVKAVNTGAYWPSSITIPATVNDAAADVEAVYDSSGNAISASGITYNVTTIADEGFKSQVWFRDMATVIISEGITTIGSRAFFNYSQLTDCVIPSTVTSIGGSAFNSTGIEEFVVPASQVGGFCFKGVVKKLTFNGSVLSSQVCQGATTIEKVYINGCDVTQWGNYIFHECTQFTDGTSLPEVHIDSVTPPSLAANASTFPKDSNGKIQAKLYVPVGSEAAYRAANVWGNFVYINDSTN